MIVVEQLVDVTHVDVIGNHRLRLTFADGTIGDVDFFRARVAWHLRASADPAYFARVAVDDEAGTISWPNGVDMAPEPLYAQARRSAATQ